MHISFALWHLAIGTFKFGLSAKLNKSKLHYYITFIFSVSVVLIVFSDIEFNLGPKKLISQCVNGISIVLL